MKKILLFLTAFMIMGSLTLLNAQTFVGSDACQMCHPNQYPDWVESGHPYKFTIIENGVPPWYPPEAVNYQSTWMDELCDGSHTWNDIAGVIGGYGWKTRFVGTDGHLIGTAGSTFPTAGMGHNQINFFGGVNHGWKDYHPNDVKIYNYGCFKCHTTGGDMSGTWLANVPDLGTFSEGGVGCESCHGPGSDHAASPSKDNIDRVYEFAHQDNSIGGLQIGDEVLLPHPDSNRVNFLCGTCHNRSYTSPINSSGGFIKHHEQWDEFVATEHYEEGMTCSTCHNPHQRVIWEGGGIKMDCETCHPAQTSVTNHGPSAGCIDCHMPFAAKSGTTRGGSGYKGDVRSHLFKIIPNTETMFTADSSNVRDDDEREAALSPHFACLACHNDDGNINKTIEEAAAGAKDMHETLFISQHQDIKVGIYPNPSSGNINISFNLTKSENVSLHIYNVTGQLVFKMDEVSRPAGQQLIRWNGMSNTGAEITSGNYFLQVNTGSLTSAQKLILIR